MAQIWKTIEFAVGWLGIGLVSAYDLYLSVRFADSLPENEWNPVGLWLIGLGGVSLFMGAKMLGTIMAFGLLNWLRHVSINLGIIVTRVILALQLTLLWFLLSF